MNELSYEKELVRSCEGQEAKAETEEVKREGLHPK